MAMTTLQAIESLNRGGVVFASEVETATIQILNGLVANSEACRCEHGQFTWFFAWQQSDHESEADKANQMARAIRTQDKFKKRPHRL